MYENKKQLRSGEAAADTRKNASAANAENAVNIVNMQKNNV